MRKDHACENTDREIWREGGEAGDFYGNSIHVTKGGGIGLSVGGHVIVKPLADWHALASLRSNGLEESSASREFRQIRVNAAALQKAQEGTRDLTFPALSFDEHNTVICKAIAVYDGAVARNFRATESRALPLRSPPAPSPEDSVKNLQADSPALESSVLQDDLKELLEVAGLPTGAQPRSPHEVFQHCIRVLRARLAPPPQAPTSELVERLRARGKPLNDCWAGGAAAAHTRKLQYYHFADAALDEEAALALSAQAQEIEKWKAAYESAQRGFDFHCKRAENERTARLSAEQERDALREALHKIAEKVDLGIRRPLDASGHCEAIETIAFAEGR